ncbi:mitochondrial import inner membrane translocase subunit TIM16 [Borealophlyctis nickersoniae]|nr:mitochondrial import inner membrane translocase subunit TIM16 [Borealophlyctis nickersoniae]
MVNAARLITQIVIVGSQIFGRAFVEAYKQAAANAAKGGAAAGAGGAGRAAIDRKLNMTADEAAQILNVGKEPSMEDIVKRYETLFKANDPATGGSFYLQSKVFRAKERLEMELKRKAGVDGDPSAPSN